MKRLYSAGTALEAHEVRLFLAARGIEAKVIGDMNAWEGPLAFTLSSAPGVFVNEADLDAAAKLLEEFSAGPARQLVQGQWTCPKCNERVEAQFEICWNCQSPRGSAPIDTTVVARTEDDDEEKSSDMNLEPPPAELIAVGHPRSTWLLWLEVAAVVLVMMLYVDYLIATAAMNALGSYSSESGLKIATALACGLTVAVVLCLIRWSGERWSTFGIKRPVSADLVTATLVCVAHFVVTTLGNGIFRDILTSMYGAKYVYRLVHADRLVYHAQGWWGLVELLLLAVCVGFSEELVMRGYLIPRFERLLRSTVATVVVTAVLFGLFHLNAGILSAWNALLVGLVYGIAFAWTRRLWPVVIAHAVFDFSSFLYGATRIDSAGMPMF